MYIYPLLILRTTRLCEGRKKFSYVNKSFIARLHQTDLYCFVNTYIYYYYDNI